MMRILVVDDEKALVKGIKFNLENEGHTVETAYDGQEALEKVRESEPDLVIMDVMMPKLDGLNACMQIREFSKVPVILLTAKSEDSDKIMGFECGADDYITKPFNILELKARVRALLRRASISEHAAPSNVVTGGGITLDVERRAVKCDGSDVELTAKEFDLVELLMRNPGKVYTRESLLATIWGAEYQGDIRTVDVHVRRLREKLEKEPAEPEKIMTKWGVGYYFKD
ncbi:MAG: response regulator transcription factor [Oscillospiraceae bacterium]|nr:response regulator transcription factor [Oscillospiraceae bacterium]